MEASVEQAETAAAARRVARRRVVYVPGYDPFHARRYRELYRKEGEAQARLTGDRIAVRARPAEDLVTSWTVSAEIEGAQVATQVDVLIWSDIVKRSMSGGIAATYLRMLRTAWIYLRTGALFRLVRLRKGPVIAALYPVVFLLAQLALALACAWAVGRIIGAAVHPLAGWVGLLVVPPILAWFRRQDRWFLSYYLLHNYAFTAQDGGREPAELTERIGVFADHIADALKEPVDEVLVVGHSSGVHLAVSTLARLIREGMAPKNGPVLSFLSLGQVVPMVSFLPGASGLREDLAALSVSDRLTWVDVTAPGDGCAFALCDPVTVSGAGGPGKQWPLVISAAFTRTLKPDTWRRLRWRFFRLHFQYLCAFDDLPGRADDYNYFRITAGPQTLAARLGGRKPSPARIDRNVAGFSAAPGHVATEAAA